MTITVSLTPTVQVEVGSDFVTNMVSGETPAVAALPNDQFVVTWESGFNIYARLLNADGSAAGSDFLVKAAGGQEFFGTFPNL